MEREPHQVMQYLVEIEEAAEEILTDRHQLIELDKKRQSTRQAIRSLQNDKSTKKSWVCFGNMFLKLPREDALKMLKKDFDKLDAEINDVRVKLKPKVARLRDLEHKEELKGFSLQPLSKTELNAISELL